MVVSGVIACGKYKQKNQQMAWYITESLNVLNVRVEIWMATRRWTILHPCKTAGKKSQKCKFANVFHSAKYANFQINAHKKTRNVQLTPPPAEVFFVYGILSIIADAHTSDATSLPSQLAKAHRIPWKILQGREWQINTWLGSNWLHQDCPLVILKSPTGEPMPRQELGCSQNNRVRPTSLALALEHGHTERPVGGGRTSPPNKDGGGRGGQPPNYHG